MVFRRWLAALSLPLIVAACGLNVGEKAPPATEVKFQSSQYSCVGQIGKRAEEFLNAQLDDESINNFVSCLQNAFRAFTSKMRGKDRNAFTPEEIRTFIQDELLPKTSPRITDELLHQFMLLKQNLVGGPIDRISKTDLEAAIQILDQIRAEAVRMRPFIPVLNPKLVQYENAKTLGAKIAAAEREATMTAEAFGKIMSRSQRDYSFKDFETFLFEFRKFLKWEELFVNSHSAKEWIDLISAFKVAAVSPGKKMIKPQDWAPLFEYATKWYLNYIKFDVGVRHQPIVMEGVGLQNMIGWGDTVIDLLNKAVERQPSRVIPYESATDLIAALKSVGWLPGKIRVESLQSALIAFVNHVLGPPEDDACVRKSPGITKNAIANLAVEFTKWQEIQLALQERFAQAENRRERLKDLESKIPALAVVSPISDRAAGRDTLDRFIEAFQGPRPMFKESFDRVYLVEKDRLDIPNGFFNLSKMNLFRTIMTLVFKGYAPSSDKGVLNAKLSQPRLQAFYEDFRELGIDLGFIDKRVFNAGARTFLEAKLFTYVSDGVNERNPDLTFLQGMHEAAFLFSAGEMARDLYDHMAKICEPGAKLDVLGKPKLERICVRDNIVNAIKEVIQADPDALNTSTMPSYSLYLKSLDDTGRRRLGNILLKAAFSNRNLANERDGKRFVEYSEFTTMAVVVNYSEAVFTRYNTREPSDNILDDDEVNTNALPIFQDLALTTIPRPDWYPKWAVPQAAADHGFRFVLKNGRLPTTVGEYTDVLSRIGCNSPACAWDLKVDRTDLAQVFSALIQKISERPPPPKPVGSLTCR